eukprot:gene669-78_t
MVRKMFLSFALACLLPRSLSLHISSSTALPDAVRDGDGVPPVSWKMSKQWMRFFTNFIENNSKDDVKTALELMVKMVGNIVEHPDEHKYKTIKMTSKALNKKVLGLNNSIEAMVAIGFQSDGNAFVNDGVTFSTEILSFMQADLHQLVDMADRASETSEFIKEFHAQAFEDGLSKAIAQSMEDSRSGANQQDEDSDLAAALAASMLTSNDNSSSQK